MRNDLLSNRFCCVQPPKRLVALLFSHHRYSPCRRDATFAADHADIHCNIAAFRGDRQTGTRRPSHENIRANPRAFAAKNASPTKPGTRCLSARVHGESPIKPDAVAATQGTLYQSAMTQIRAVVFDAYGTLLNVHAAMAKHADRLGANWPAISADWRQKQLEYSWVRSLAGPSQHRDFWRLTREALAWTAARHGIAGAAVLADVLMAYRHLDPYPEVPAVLRRLRDMGLPTAILSNGEPGMLADAVRSARIEPLLDAVLSIETVGIFKPDPKVYQLAVDRLGFEASQMAFVSSNPWDAFGAHAAGYRVFWINRTGQPAEYGLRDVAVELTDLAALPDALM
jgi:2-haloacid dehalogenase